MERASVIPTPASQKWREFRIRYLPIIVFGCTIGAIFYLWREHVMPPGLVGQVEPVHADVRTRDAGLLTNLYVKRFQAVRAGDLIASVIVTDTRRVSAELQLLDSQIAIAKVEMNTIVDRERLAFVYQDLRNEFMREKTQLETAKAQLPRAAFDVTLSSNLLKEKVLSEFDFHRYQGNFDSLKAQVEQLTNNLQQIQSKLESSKAIEELASSGDTPKEIGARLAMLKAQQEKVEMLLKQPLMLRSPIDGVVSTIYRQEGETVIADEPIVTISATSGDRIVGYLRAPYYVEPKPGMRVLVRCRSGDRREGEARILGIGASFEVITNAAFIRPNVPHEMGLPLAITVPPALRTELRPGEMVDITVKP
ncbi:MAG TPA: HlyD family efflux transporter periplasmic adaptor subunit [Verrucomicrobiae bacterium]|jgi:multidrug resistance efflux pump|nr:HlyD family efflux transporter periplasmic adaptor subunit [Verrucomicrobiae bacterium]